MSIASELNRLLQAKSNLATSITNKGVTVPADTTLDGYAALVDQIQQGGTLPYDAEIEYLRGTGTQYIDSGIECTGDLSVRCKYRVSTDVNSALLGGIYNYGNTIFRHHLTPNGNKGVFYWFQNNSQSTPSITYSWSVNTWCTFEISAHLGAYKIDSTLGTFTPLSSSLTTQANYGIFARLSGNVATQIRTGNNDLAFLQLSRNGVLLRDFIPVRVGQVGYMYDKVSGELFGNDGTGSFTLGPDVT